MSIHPAESASWQDARSLLITEAKRPLKAAMSADIAAAPDEATQNDIRAKFEADEKQLEHTIDHQPRMLCPAHIVSLDSFVMTCVCVWRVWCVLPSPAVEMHLVLGVDYNFLSK